MNKLKIAICHPHVTKKWWAIKLLLQIANYLNSNYDLNFFTFDLDKQNCFFELNKNINIINLNYKWIKKIYWVIKLAFIFRKYDLVFAGNNPMHFAAWLSKMIFNKKLKTIWFCQNIPVYYIQENKSFFVNIKKIIEKLLIMPFIDLIIANSKFIQNKIKDCYKKNAYLIYPFVDIDFFKNTQKIKNNKYLILYVNSRLVNWKNIQLAINVFNTLKNKFKNLKLIISWDWVEKEKLKNLSKNEKNIIFTWEISQNEIKKYYQECDIFLFTSLIDAFWITIIEAMSMERPVIALNKGWVWEIIKHWYNGFLAKNEKEFIKYVEYLLKNKNKGLSVWKNWRNNVILNFSEKVIIQNLQKIFNILKLKKI